MPESRFPEAFLEIGKDEDHSYNSLRTTRLSDGRLKIDVAGWGIAEYGLGLNIETGEILKLNIMGFCGTVPIQTWTKISSSHILEMEEATNVGQIVYRGYVRRDEGYIEILFTLGKRQC